MSDLEPSLIYVSCEDYVDALSYMRGITCIDGTRHDEVCNMHISIQMRTMRKGTELSIANLRLRG